MRLMGFMAAAILAIAPANAEDRNSFGCIYEGEVSLESLPASGEITGKHYPRVVFEKIYRTVRYPEKAAGLGLGGVVELIFAVERSGSLAGWWIAKSSGEKIFDSAAVATLREAAPFPPFPPDVDLESWCFTIPLAYEKLPQPVKIDE